MIDSVELASQVQELLESYVKEEIALDALQDALDDLAPQLSELPDNKYASRAVDHAEILLAELILKHRSEEEVRALIRDEILLPTVEVVDASAAAVTATNESDTSRIAVSVAA